MEYPQRVSASKYHSPLVKMITDLENQGFNLDMTAEVNNTSGHTGFYNTELLYDQGFVTLNLKRSNVKVSLESRTS